MRGGSNASALGWIAKARECFRRVTEIGLQGNVMFAGDQNIIIAALNQKLAGTGGRCLEVPRRNAFRIGRATREAGKKSVHDLGKIVVVRIERLVPQRRAL